MHDIFIQQMREEVTRLGAKELKTPADVDTAFRSNKGTMLVVVNSTCGCAAGGARPALSMALRNSAVPDTLVTVFAGQENEATARAREYFTNQPPSSPSFALLRDVQFVEMVHRHQIEGRSPEQIAANLKDLFNRHCVKV